jgi:hypothetical protein
MFTYGSEAAYAQTVDQRPDTNKLVVPSPKEHFTTQYLILDGYSPLHAVVRGGDVPFGS